MAAYTAKHSTHTSIFLTGSRRGHLPLGELPDVSPSVLQEAGSSLAMSTYSSLMMRRTSFGETAARPSIWPVVTFMSGVSPGTGVTTGSGVMAGRTTPSVPGAE